MYIIIIILLLLLLMRDIKAIFSTHYQVRVTIVPKKHIKPFDLVLFKVFHVHYEFFVTLKFCLMFGGILLLYRKTYIYSTVLSTRNRK